MGEGWKYPLPLNIEYGSLFAVIVESALLFCRRMFKCSVEKTYHEMPRKKKSETKKGYFYETEENAIVDYINAADETEKKKAEWISRQTEIQEYLQPALELYFQRSGNPFGEE